MVLGRASGISDDEFAHLLDDPLPGGMFPPAEEAVIVYARASTWMQPITDEMYSALGEHFSNQQLIEISMTVGLSNMVTRLHATFHTEVDERTVEATCDVVETTSDGVVRIVEAP